MTAATSDPSMSPLPPGGRSSSLPGHGLVGGGRPTPSSSVGPPVGVNGRLPGMGPPRSVGPPRGALSPRCYRPLPPGYRPGGPRPGGPRVYHHRPPGDRPSPVAGSPPYSPRMGGGPRRGGPPPGFRGHPRGHPRSRFPPGTSPRFPPGGQPPYYQPIQVHSTPSSPSPLLHSKSYQNMIVPPSVAAAAAAAAAAASSSPPKNNPAVAPGTSFQDPSKVSPATLIFWATLVIEV